MTPVRKARAGLATTRGGSTVTAPWRSCGLSRGSLDSPGIMPRWTTACDVASNSRRASAARLLAPAPSRTTTAPTAGRTRRRASRPAATAPGTRPQTHEHIANVLLEGPSSNRCDPARAAARAAGDLPADLGADGRSTHDQQATKDALGHRPPVPEGGRGARGTGSPDPVMIRTPRVSARVPVAETAMASACADGMPTVVTSPGARTGVTHGAGSWRRVQGSTVSQERSRARLCVRAVAVSCVSRSRLMRAVPPSSPRPAALPLAGRPSTP